MQVSGDNGQMRKITDVNTKESAGRALFNAFFMHDMQIFNALFCTYSHKMWQSNAEICLTCAWSAI